MRAVSLAALLLVACQEQEVASSSLIGGTASVLLSVSQQRAIGRLMVGDAMLCTGWASASRHLVTAGHCFNEQVTAGQVDFIPGGVAGDPRFPLVRVEKHPSLDVALVTLGVELPELTPLELNRDVADQRWVGQPLEIHGGGFGTSPMAGVTAGSFPLISVGPVLLTVGRSQTQGVCRGDSGGPFVRSFETAPFTRVVALVSAGAASCEGSTWGPRADVFSEWVMERMSAPLPALSEPCAVDTAPRCEGDVAWACVEGWWRPRECASTGSACGWRSESEGLGCLPAPCGALDGHGVCARGVAQWCGPGGPEQLDCAARGLGCGWDDGGVRCQPCDACGGQCVDLLNDAANCGACGTSCDGACEAGVCTAPVAEPEPEPRGGCSVTGAPALCLLLSLALRQRGEGRGEGLT
ncbi:MAG: hypothetical protein Q8K32_32300 [Archangium sp.]|nr:hypothetical protein [Archangium sp.]